MYRNLFFLLAVKAIVRYRARHEINKVSPLLRKCEIRVSLYLAALVEGYSSGVKTKG